MNKYILKLAVRTNKKLTKEEILDMVSTFGSKLFISAPELPFVEEFNLSHRAKALFTTTPTYAPHQRRYKYER